MATLTTHRRVPGQRSLLDDQRDRRTRPAARAPQRPASRPSGATLDDLVAGAWESLQVTHAAACPVCAADLTPRFSAGPHPVAAACRSCGSRLS